MEKLRRLLRSRLRAGRDFADEIEGHIALEAERLVAEGWTPACSCQARKSWHPSRWFRSG